MCQINSILHIVSQISIDLFLEESSGVKFMCQELIISHLLSGRAAFVGLPLTNLSSVSNSGDGVSLTSSAERDPLV